MKAGAPDGLGHTLLNWIPLDADRLLQLECGDGGLGEAYKLRNPKATYVGVERAGPAAAAAATRIDRVIEGEFESLDVANLSEAGGFDVVILDGVLERLEDVPGSLRRLTALLRPGGHLLCVIINPGHWSQLAELLQGRPPSRESDTAGRRRVFTLQSLSETLKAAELSPVKARRARLGDQGQGERWISALGAAIEELGLGREAFADRAAVSHYIVSCRRASERPRPAAQFSLLANSPAFLDVRTRLPAQQLETLPSLLVTYGERNVTLPRSAPEIPKILLQQRGWKGDGDAWLRQLGDLIGKQWVVITEHDDHPDLFRELGRGQPEGMEFALSAAHAVQTSTPALVEAFKPMNAEVRRFDNALFSLPPFVDRSEGAPKVFYGALNRERFSGSIARALTPAIQASPRVEFVVVHDKAFFEALPTQRKRFLPAMPYEAYLRTMSECHIALMPLEGTFGESFKSDIKFLEASGMGLATIASPAVYAQTIVDGETGLIAESEKDWAPALARLLKDRALRTRMARNAWDYVRSERMFAYQTAERRDWYLSVWDRRLELTASLVQRHPKLAEHLPAAYRQTLS